MMKLPRSKTPPRNHPPARSHPPAAPRQHDAQETVAVYCSVVNGEILRVLGEDRRGLEMEAIAARVTVNGEPVAVDLLWQLIDGPNGLIAAGLVKRTKPGARFAATTKAV